MTTTELRNADLSRLVDVLQEQSARRWDVVVPAKAMYMVDSELMAVMHAEEALIDDDGVHPPRQVRTKLAPTIVAEEQLADRLGIPRAYWRKCREEGEKAIPSGVLAMNVNYWLDQDDRSFYVRALTAGPDDDGHGILRSVMSDRFRAIDNVDVTMATLDGIQRAGLDPSTLEISADLSLRRMYIRINATTVAEEAADLVARYEVNGRTGRDYPMVNAGVEIRNSDVGQGAFLVVPRITWQICTNGMTRTQDSQRQVHLGGKQEEGVVDWSDETVKRHLSLISSKTTDAVRTFLTPQYLAGVVAELRGYTTRVADPVEAVEAVTKKLSYSDDERKLILNAFLQGGDLTPLGVAQAFTFTAQSADADRRAEMEDDAWQAMTLAKAF